MLRATTSLARLIARQSNRDEALTMFAEIYNQFTEGFDTVDLKDAKASLEADRTWCRLSRRWRSRGRTAEV